MDDADREALRSRLRSLGRHAAEVAAEAANRLKAEYSGKGRFPSDAHRSAEKSAIRTLFQAHLADCARVIHAAGGDFASVGDLLKSVGREALDSIIRSVRPLPPYPPATHRVGFNLRDAQERRAATEAAGALSRELEPTLTDALNEFRLGLAGLRPLRQEPAALHQHFMNAMIASPGGIQQSGSHNVQSASSTVEVGKLVAAIDGFLSMPEVQALPEDDRISLADVADALKAELTKPTVEKTKARRWAQRLVGLAGQLGLNVAASALATILLASL